MQPARFPVLRTVRFRITAAAALAVGVVLVVAAFALLANQRRQLTATIDSTLEQRVDDIVADLGNLPVEEFSLAGTQSEDRLAQIVDDGGQVVASTANVVGDPPAVPLPVSGQSLTSVDRLPIEDDRFRVIARRISTDRGSLVVIVAENSEDVEESVEALRTNLGVIVPLTVLMLVAIVWWLVGRTLRPVEAIRRRVSDIGADRLDQRVPESATGDEIDRLAQTMNGMLDRLEDAALRQRRFVADTSHELRTPLTRMRLALEVDGADEPRTNQEARDEVAASLHEEVVGLQRTVEDLLVLAQADDAHRSDKREPVDVDDLVGREVRRLRVDDRVTVDMSGVTGANVMGDAGQLARMVRNLLDNAARHAESMVIVSCREDGEEVELIVSDDGPGVAAEDRERIFERFARLDQARSAEAGGTGLGLAIVWEIVHRHGGTIEVDDAPSGGARFTVHLPTSTPWS